MRVSEKPSSRSKDDVCRLDHRSWGQPLGADTWVGFDRSLEGIGEEGRSVGRRIGIGRKLRRRKKFSSNFFGSESKYGD